jgi:D-alanyl-D-alanine carboxypeptidase
MQGNRTIHSLSVYIITSLIVLICMMPLLASAKVTRNNYAKQNIGSNERYAALVVDANSGLVLHQENAGKLRYPASLTKMMTLYLTFEALQNNQLSMDSKIAVSPFAASRPRMNMGLRAGEQISVRDAVLSLIVRSANDTAVVLAEAISGNEAAFARKMTERAQNLGMTNTVFRNASGLPDNAQRTTAFDLARLAIALRRDFPEYYPLFSRTSFTYKGRVWAGHNRLTSNYPGADGLKTGFVNASGFNLVTSAKRGNTKLIGVVMGGNTARSRDNRMVALLDRYFQKVSGSVINTAYADERPAPTIQKKVKKTTLAAKKTRATQQANVKKKSAALKQQAALKKNSRALNKQASLQKKPRTANQEAYLR